MAEEINISVNAKIKSGPTVSFSNSLSVDGYDKLDIDIVNGVTEVVQLLPVATTSVHLLLIKSTKYDDLITYTVNGGGASIKLDSPQSFIGTGSLSAVNAAVPETLEISNGTGDPITVQILVGRNAT